MKLYIMRHGEADHQETIDEKRELTDYGKTEVVDVAETIKGIDFDAVIVSPFVRAQQTAAILIKQFKYSGSVTTCELFCPESAPKQAHDYIDAFLMDKEYRNILIVSHMPLVSFLMAELTVDKKMPIFPTAALASIDYHTAQMKGQFIEMLCPFHACDNEHC